jgi:putative heme-binding domain-containing protein
MLARTSNPNVPAAVLKDWFQRVPSLRASIVTTLLTRDEWTRQLLRAVGNGVVNPTEVPDTHRQALANHADDEIRQLSQKYLPSRNTVARAKVIEEYQAVASLQGDAIRGAMVFKEQCASCHSYLSQGMDVGPNLKAYYNKSASDFVTAILDPNVAVEPRYASYVVVTEDDRTIMGVIANETASHFELIQPGGLRENILRSGNPQLRATGLSLMPEGLEQRIPPQAMADLIAYLKSGG